MKIHQLAIGARFEYEGEEYVKTGPLFATGKDGQRLIPKYAVLKPLAVARTADGNGKARLAKATVLGAFEVFLSECRAMIPADRQAAMEAARERFLKAIDE